MLGTIGVVAGLIFAFCFDASGSRLELIDDIDTIWGDMREDMVDVHGMLVGIAASFSFIAMLQGVFFGMFLSQINASKTNDFMQRCQKRIQSSFPILVITLVSFAFAILLQLTLNYPAWVSVVAILLLFLLAVWFLLVHQSLNNLKLEVGREYMRDTYGVQGTKTKAGSCFNVCLPCLKGMRERNV